MPYATETVTVRIRDNDDDEPLWVGLSFVDENGVPYGENIHEGDRFRVKVSAVSEVSQIPLHFPVSVGVSLSAAHDNRVSDIGTQTTTFTLTIPAGETGATSEVYTATDDSLYLEQTTVSASFSESREADGSISTPFYRVLSDYTDTEITILENDLPPEVFYLSIVDGNDNEISEITEGDNFTVQFESDTPAQSDITLTYGVAPPTDVVSGLVRSTTFHRRTVTVPGGNTSAGFEFSTIDDLTMSVPRDPW